MEHLYTLPMLLSIATFTLSTAVTPGPNNIMLLSSGLTFGLKRTVPHILGVVIGFPIMLILVGLGLGAIFEKFPIILEILKVIGVLYLFWMAKKIATNSATIEVTEGSKPFSFLQSAGFQWVNPKAWIMGISAISIFVTSTENSILQVCIISFIYMLSGVISCTSWAVGGVVLKKFLKNEKTVKAFNITMAILLILSIVPVLFE